jgi:alkylation response protein AidB-like acyl-CoA dehydrogenase
LGLRGMTEKLLYRGTRTGVRAGAAAQSRFQPLKKLLPGQRLKVGKKTPALFDLTPTEEQEMLQDMLRRFAADVMVPEASRADKEWGISKEILEQSFELGLSFLALPEALDGAATERSPMTSCLMLEELSRGDMSLALAIYSPLAFMNALTEFGSTSQQEKYFPAFGGEEFVAAAIALMEPRARFDASALATTATPMDDSYRLNGVKTFVALGEEAQVLLVFAHLEDAGPRGFLVETPTRGLKVKAEPSMGLGGAALARVTLDNVVVPKSALLGEEEVAYEHQRLIDLSRLALCSLAVGTSQAVLDYVIPYCNERVAFGEPITHRQSVAFAIADMATELEAMRLMVYRAASRAEQGLDFHREAFLAHVFCSEHGMDIGCDGVQLLGGHGFVCEHPVERWYRQLRSIAILQGTALA